MSIMPFISCDVTVNNNVAFDVVNVVFALLFAYVFINKLHVVFEVVIPPINYCKTLTTTVCASM